MHLTTTTVKESRTVRAHKGRRRRRAPVGRGQSEGTDNAAPPTEDGMERKKEDRDVEKHVNMHLQGGRTM